MDVGGYKVVYHPVEGKDSVVIDFTPPFRRLDMLTELEHSLRIQLPSPEQLHTEEANKFFDKLCQRKSESADYLHAFPSDI